jgi:hypothetical protein
MAKKKKKAGAARRNESSPDLVAELWRLYGGAGVQADQFGRRQAIPSEVERVLRSTRQ